MGKPNRITALRNEPSLWGNRPKQPSFDHTGWGVRKYPAAAEVFFLDFPFYRTYQELITTEQSTPKRKRYPTLTGD